MKQSEKPAIVAGAFLMTFAGVILTSLVIQLLDFGIAPNAFAYAISNFGKMLYTVYGISSFLIPVYLFVSAILLYLPGFTKRRGIYLLFSIIPFFTIVGVEKFGTTLFASEAAVYKLIKYSAIVLVSILLIAIEYLITGIIVDSMTGGKKKTSANVSHAASSDISDAEIEKKDRVGVGIIESGDEDLPELPYAEEEESSDDSEAETASVSAPAEPATEATLAAPAAPAEKPVKYVHRAEVETTAAEIGNIDQEEPITVVFGSAPSMDVESDVMTSEAEVSSGDDSFPLPTEEIGDNTVVVEEENVPEDEVNDEVLTKLDEAMKEFELPPEASIPDDVPVTPINLAPAAAAVRAAGKAESEGTKGSLLAAASAYNVSNAPSDSVIHMTPVVSKVTPDVTPEPEPVSADPDVPVYEETDAPLETETVFEEEAVPQDVPYDGETEPVYELPISQEISEPEAYTSEDEAPVASSSGDICEPAFEETNEPAITVSEDPVFEESAGSAYEDIIQEEPALEPDNAFESSFEPVFGLPEEEEPAAVSEIGESLLSESERSEVDSALKEIDASLYSDEEAAFFDDPFEEQLSLDDEAGGDADEGDDKIPFEVAPVKGAYSVPTEGILNSFENNPYWIIDDETKQAGAILKETLSEFKIEAEVTGIRKGPVVTMFEILPAPGVKLTKIVALQDNIALRLAASSVRIVAPIPGKQAVGVEVPNRERAMVSFRELIEKELPAYDKMQIPVVLGKDITGDAQVLDLAATPHLLIAGSTGSGKSVCVNSMILSILYKRSPNDVKLILIDPKIVELKLYNDIPHLLTPVITEPKKAFQSLQYCLCEMERRYAMLDHMGVRDIKSYNKRIKERHVMQEKLPYIVVVIDEFADLMATTGKELESTIARLCAMSRAVGIHLVLATQRPSIDVITGLIKANIPTRIAFMVASKTDSRIIIDQMGAEKLLGKGDMLYASAIDPFPVRIQGTFVTDDEVENVVEYVKKYGPPEYIDEEIFVEDEDDETAEPSLFSDGEDPLYDQALEIVVQAGKASASYIQRRLKIGYNRAARLVEEMEERGIVGPANGSKPREIIHIP